MSMWEIQREDDRWCALYQGCQRLNLCILCTQTVPYQPFDLTWPFQYLMTICLCSQVARDSAQR